MFASSASPATAARPQPSRPPSTRLAARSSIPIDGDRQNDPADIPRLLEQIDAGFDVVSGWRKQRHDSFLTRKVPSWLANRLVARLSGVPLHDFGCTLKAYRRRVLQGVRLYGEMHRFIPIFAAWHGAKVIELVVNHRPRTAGKTKYGLGRTFNVVLDLILIRFLQRYSQRPLHFFGRFGLWSFGLGILSIFAMLYFKYVFPWPALFWPADSPNKSFIATPLPTITAMFFLGGFFCILMGILAEVVMRTYYESQAKTTYLLSETRDETEPEPEPERRAQIRRRRRERAREKNVNLPLLVPTLRVETLPCRSAARSAMTSKLCRPPSPLILEPVSFCRFDAHPFPIRLKGTNPRHSSFRRSASKRPPCRSAARSAMTSRLRPSSSPLILEPVSFCRFDARPFPIRLKGTNPRHSSLPRSDAPRRNAPRAAPRRAQR